jgi:predicted enzyme related to lactoylglutathione lyase
MEVGRRVAGHIRVALEVDDTEQITDKLTGAGGELIAAPRLSPFKAVTSRIAAPAGLQLSLWSLADEDTDPT